MDNLCPNCQQELNWTHNSYHCKTCQQGYVKMAYCEKCDEPLEKLKACGAVSYFCNHCNELKSKSVVRFEFKKV